MNKAAKIATREICAKKAATAIIDILKLNNLVGVVDGPLAAKLHGSPTNVSV